MYTKKIIDPLIHWLLTRGHQKTHIMFIFSLLTYPFYPDSNITAPQPHFPEFDILGATT